MVDIGKAGQKLYSEITVDQKTFVHEWKDIIKNIVRRI